jgi:hypothetical protein
MKNRPPHRAVVPIQTPYYAKCAACSWRSDVYSADEGRDLGIHHTKGRPARCKVFLLKRWRSGSEEIIDIIERRAISRKR